MWDFFDMKRKTLPAISRVVGLSNQQKLWDFLSELLEKYNV